MKVKVLQKGKPEVSILRNSLMGLFDPSTSSDGCQKINILQDVLITPVFDLVTPPQQDLLSDVSIYLDLFCMFSYS